MASQSSRLNASYQALTISTFSCDIACAVSRTKKRPPECQWRALQVVAGRGFRSGLALALHRTDALALVLELRESLPAVVLALVLAGRRDQHRLGQRRGEVLNEARAG